MEYYKTLSELHKANGWPLPEHPLLSVLGCQVDCTLGEREFISDCYMISLKKLRAGVIMYGRTKYDHTSGSMLFVKPRQIIEMKSVQLEEDSFMILIHEDYLAGHALYEVIQGYGYFDYEVNEALHLAPKEETIMWDLYQKISDEYRNNMDEYSREIILSHVASILTYTQRYYKRQFFDRTALMGKTVTRFYEVLNDRLKDPLTQRKGLPTVAELASKLFLSRRYLSDLLKQETGKTAMELIHASIISKAKNLLRSDNQGIAEIAYQMGFENTSYFTRLFKKETGIRPMDYRKLNLN